METALLDYFKCMVVPNNHALAMNYKFLTKGIMLNFKPTPIQEIAIIDYIRDNKVKTLFSTDEVNNLSTDEKIIKQLSHYCLQFGTNYTFDVMRNTDDNSDPMTITLIRGVTVMELQQLVDDCLYTNKPVKDSKILDAIIKHYKCTYRVNDIKNNEMRVMLFDVQKDVFRDGDDAVRYIVNTCTESDLLIKSKQVIEAVKANSEKVHYKFLINHKLVLAEVFNRHKAILMALKTGSKVQTFRCLLNQISHLSKQKHRPYVMPPVKTFMADVFKDIKKYKYANLSTFTLRDKLKLLNLLEFKLERSTTDIFVIRNGKTHVEQNRPVYDLDELRLVIKKVLKSIKIELSHLEGKVIVLPENIDYGLPVSRKQSVGHLPFGTKLTITDKQISAGVYWKDEWGAYDIDLSAVDTDGNRTGWGVYSGYNKAHGLEFSGDIVSAPNGAMEFLTSSQETYGLFANIFNGEIGCEIEVLVGERARKQWIDKTHIREKLALKSRGNVVGFVKDKTFIVFYGRMSESRMSEERNKVMFTKALTMRWTLKVLFDHLGIAYLTEAGKSDYDLSYAGFTYDKLENLLGI